MITPDWIRPLAIESYEKITVISWKDYYFTSVNIERNINNTIQPGLINFLEQNCL